MAKDIFAKPTVKAISASLAALGLLASLSACGVRGPLQPPTANTNTQTEIAGKSAGPDATGEQKTDISPTKAPDNGFILDPLL